MAAVFEATGMARRITEMFMVIWSAPISLRMRMNSAGKAMSRRPLMASTVLSSSILRLIAFPALFIALLKLAGADQMTMNISVILLAMPVASNTAAMAERYGGDYVFASACVSVSTLLSVATLPVWAAVGEYVFR